MKAADLLGKRFGRLEVRAAGEMRQRRRHWLCLCECGTWRQVAHAALIDGSTKSCGCLRRELGVQRVRGAMGGRRPHDLTGRSFGRLTVLGPLEYRERIYWPCLCACGERHTVAANLLVGGRVRSCGCLKVESIARAREVRHRQRASA